MLKNQVDYLLWRNQRLKTQISCFKALVLLRELPRNQWRFSEHPLDKNVYCNILYEINTNFESRKYLRLSLSMQSIQAR